MDQPKVNYSSSMRKHIFGMTSSRDGPGFIRRPYVPFQAIIEKGKQAKAQDEHDQYEAKKVKRETDIKNAARIRHAEAEANRHRAEESRLSIDDHKGNLLDEMTKNIKAILENQYREEIREKVYEEEDKIISAYEHDIKDQTKARLVKELESVVKAKLGAKFEPEVKQQLSVELMPVVKAELRAQYETEVKQQLVKELGPEVEADLRAKYEAEVKQQLAKELQSGVKEELRAKYEEEIKYQLMNDPKPTIVHELKDTQTNDCQNESQGRHDASHTPDGEPFRFTRNDVDNNGGEYPDLSHHQHLINQNGVRNGQQEAESVRNLENTETNGDAVDMPRGTKRSLSVEDVEDEDPYAHHSKRSRSASFNKEEQQSPSGYENGPSNGDSSCSRLQQPYQGVRYNGEENQDFLQYKGDASDEDAQVDNGYKMGGGGSGYSSSDEVQGSHGNTLGGRGADYNSAVEVQGMNGNLLHSEDLPDYESDEDVQGMNGNFLDREGADYDRAENVGGTNGTFFDRGDAHYYGGENFQGSNGHLLDGEATEYLLDGEATEFFGSDSEDEEEEEDEEDEEEDEEQYESEEEEQYSTAPQAAPDPNAGNGVITISNTQDTAFVLSDSEDDEVQAEDEVPAEDEDKTLIGYVGPAILNGPKLFNVAVEESLFLDARDA